MGTNRGYPGRAKTTAVFLAISVLAAWPGIASPLTAAASGLSLVYPSVAGRAGPPGLALATLPGEFESSITPGDIAVEFALSQVGKPYVYGAIGPYGYDCSGLALASWRAAGVQLPRTAAQQYYAGSHVDLNDVQPGDLIFWAADVSDPATIYHVAISLGGERTVQASQTGHPVEVLALWPSGLVPLATRPRSG
ncbi:MAG TPA: C40 family peptidase [Acidimicrobiales bacterium]|nr:C40 family peptidase [Acidimicrobiales bacterium]